MSDPQPDRLKTRPRRAAPLQPDKLGRGNGTLPAADEAAAELERAAAAKQREQTDAAHENTRKGYS